MNYLMIRNRGIADPFAITVLGVSTSRYSGRAGVIGCFGSGCKNSISLFLRNGINPVFVSGNLKMEFFTKPQTVSGKQYNQVWVKYSGKDLDGNSKTSTEACGFCVEWGTQDWTKLAYGFREFVANAIDASIEMGGSYKDVEIEVKDAPRAKADHTAVFLPLTPEVQQVWTNIGTLFLHYSHPNYLNRKILPKLSDSKHILVYKKGVLVRTMEGESVFDYNLDSELTLDESRNAQVWDVRYACSKAIANANQGELAQIFKAQLENKDVWESKLESVYLYNEHEDKKVQEEKKKNFQAAFKTIAGDNAVICTGSKQVKDFVERKGFKPVQLPESWHSTLEKYGVTNDNKVLEGLERDGFIVSEATADQLLAVDKVWEMLKDYDMLNGREKPPVKAFTSVMSGESQTWGLYKDGTVYIHTDANAMSPMLLKIALEEVVHHTSGSTDFSRDLQDYLFRLIVKMWF